MCRIKSLRNSLSFIVIIIAAATLFFVSCSGTKKTDGSNTDIVEIKEKMFIAQVQDIYNNAEDYLGKTIKLEGVFKNEKSYDGDQYCFVIRYGPGCCGNDGIVGFEIKWDENNAKPYPKADSWVESTGILRQYEMDGYADYLYLDLISLNVLSKRGAETVVQ